MEKKEIIVFTEGDAYSVDTWSNVPYFLTKYLEKNGAVIHRVNIDISRSSILIRGCAFLLKSFLYVYRKIDRRNREFIINRTVFYKKVIERKMRAAISRYPEACFILSTNFSHSAAGFTSAVTCLFCDWPIDYLIEKIQMREPGYFERKAIKRQQKEILDADILITLFPNVQEYMEKKYKRQVYYLGNVINSEIEDFNRKEIIQKKFESNHILFIGRKKYLKSALNLINAVEKYNLEHDDKLYVDFIGLNRSDCPDVCSAFITFFGYLSKKDQMQRDIYYENLFRAKVIVNSTENWSGASSIIEAMYYATPVIVTPNKDFTKMFGDECSFGYYCDKNSAEEVLSKLEAVQKLSYKEFENLGRQSNEKVKTFTWENYTHKILNILETYKDKRF